MSKIVLTDKRAPLLPDPEFDEDPFVNSETGKRRKLEKAPSTSSKRARKADERTLLLTGAYDELAHVLPHAEDVGGDLHVYPVFNEHLQNDLRQELERHADDSVSPLVSDCNEGWRLEFDDAFPQNNVDELLTIVDIISDKLVELKGTGAILVLDGGHVDPNTKGAAKGDVAKLTLKWALLMLKHKDRALYDGLNGYASMPSNVHYRNFLNAIGRAASLVLMRARAREHGLYHSM